MKLEVIIPTYNRADMLRRTLTSMVSAKKPESMSVRITVIDNNSNDDTKRVVEEFQASGNLDLHYLFEPRQGRTYALNTGIRNADCDLLGTIDDDEELAEDWFVEVEKVFTERWGKLDFMSGKCSPRYEVDPPKWMPHRFNGVIGKIDCGEDELVFGKNFDGILSGGNSVIKLSVFQEIGLYNESLGRRAEGLLSCDDDEIHHRLLSHNKRGIHNPRMVIYHFVSKKRLTKKYHRQWCYGWGMSLAIRNKIISIQPVPEILGVPRYLYGEMFHGLIKMSSQFLRLNFDAAFEHELPFWVLMGYLISARRNNLSYDKMEDPA